jgi:hypothetical protein
MGEGDGERLGLAQGLNPTFDHFPPHNCLTFCILMFCNSMFCKIQCFVF